MKRRNKTEFNVGEKFRILIPKQTPAGGFSFKVSGNLTKLQGIAHKGTPTIQNAVVLLERSEEKQVELAVSWKRLRLQINQISHILQMNRINRIKEIMKSIGICQCFSYEFLKIYQDNN